MLDNLRNRIAEILAPKVFVERDEAVRKANTDDLTELPNRRAFELALPRAEKERHAFVFFDLNNFGQVNKIRGHEEGDRVLKYYADVLANVAHNYKARAFRYGGDEFVLIVSPKFAGKVRDAIERRALVKNFGTFSVSISGTVGSTAKEADALLQARKAERKQALENSFALQAA